MGREVFSSFEQIIFEKVDERNKAQPEEIPEHKDKMLVNATVCEQATRYPVDINLLNESREIMLEPDINVHPRHGSILSF